MSHRFEHVAWGIRRITLNSVTYTATYYPTANGMRGYWTVRTSDMADNADNDWYEPSWAVCRNAILTVGTR